MLKKSSLPWILLSASLIVLFLNFFFFQQPILGIVATLVYFLCFAWWLAEYVAHEHHPLLRLLSAMLILLSALSLIGAIVYRFINLSPLAIFAVILVTPLLFLLGVQALKPTAHRTAWPLISFSIPRDRAGMLLVGMWVFAIALAYLALIQAGTVEAIRSPWAVVSSTFFLWTFVAHLLGAMIIWRNKESDLLNILILAGLVGLHILVALLVYRVGYGFDQFIHQATEKIIFNSGVVYPKPWYYLGQYALTVVFAFMSGLSVEIIDRLLVPLLATIAIPLVFLLTLPRRDHVPVMLAPLFLLWLPLSTFIQTTPQALANLLLIAIIFIVAFASRSRARNVLVIFLAFACLFTHPLAGIPAFLLIELDALNHYSRKTWPLFLGALTMVPILPAIFLFFQSQNTTTVTQFPQPAGAALFSFFFETRYHFILDSVYTIGFNIALLLLILTVASLIYIYRQHQWRACLPLLLLAGVLFIDGIVLSATLSFSYLIAYEKNIFAARLLELGWYLLLPIIILGLLKFTEALSQTSRTLVYIVFLFIATLGTIGVYLSQPRFDTYAFDRGYSTSIHDIRTVASIEQTTSDPYVVLANQAVSAAALKEVGFKQYFSRADVTTGEQIFFYPIPTGGSLYQHYLSMVYEEPRRATMISAMNLAGVDRAYFVLNDYWFNFEMLREQAQQSADRWWTIDNGKNYVFEYRR